MVAQAVAGPFRNVGASTFKIGPGPVAHTTDVHNANAVVFVITNTVVVLVCRTIPTTFARGVKVFARGVVDGGRRVEVARRFVGAACTTQGLTRSIVVCGRWGKVARHGIRAAPHFQLVAHAIAVGIVEAIALTVVVHLGIVTRASICRCGVVVAGLFVLTTDNFEFVTNAVLVRIVHAVPVAVVVQLGVFARSVVFCGCFVEVACCRVRATKNFEFIAHPIAICVVQAVAIAVVELLGVLACTGICGV